MRIEDIAMPARANLVRTTAGVLRWLTCYLCCCAPAGALTYYDPAAQTDAVSAPAGVVTVSVTDQMLMTIPLRFYGLNINPGTVRTEFANTALLAALKPDSVRIMTQKRTDWLPGVRKTYVLSPQPTQFDWSELDALVNAIVAIPSEPFIALGFGPPSWLTGSNEDDPLQPPPPNRLQSYASHMADIVRHARERWPTAIALVTLENEPENVGYAFDDYRRLVDIATSAIRREAPGVLIGGPTIGYATWMQPDNRKLYFASTMALLRDSNAPFDFIDWHVYATAPSTVLGTVNTVRALYGQQTPLIISELNLDWRYSGDYVERSRQNNTGWSSVAWLAYVYDMLQQLGMQRAFYFAWRENALGLVDARVTEVRPNYFLLRGMINELGRVRVKTQSTHHAIGCIATIDGGMNVLIYNRAQSDIDVKLQLPNTVLLQTTTYDERWVRANAQLGSKQVPERPPLITALSDKTMRIPAGGFVLAKVISNPPTPPGDITLQKQRAP